VTLATAARCVLRGALMGVGIAAIAMAAYCVVLLWPVEPSHGIQARDDSSDRFGDVILFGVITLGLTWGPISAASGGLIAFIVHAAGRRASSTRPENR
jgi:hypothetical protein